MASYPSQAELTEVRALLDASDYCEAWRLAGTLKGAREKDLARSEILYRGGDPAGAFSAARAGLETAPGDLDLLFWATGSSIWLRDAERAQAYSRELRARVEDARPRLSPGESEAWTRTVEDFSNRSQELAQHDRALDLAVTRARTVSLGFGAGLFLILVWVARSSHGRSSNPVS